MKMKFFELATILLLLFPLCQSQAQGVDSDGDGTPDVTDFYPFNSFKSIDDWGQMVESYPEVFVARDVSELNKEGLIRDLKLAANYFGK